MFSFGNDWRPCPPGELLDLAERLRQRRWAGIALAAVAIVFSSAALGFSAWQVELLVTGYPDAPPLLSHPDTFPGVIQDGTCAPP